MVRAESLFRGARVALIAPSGPVEREKLESGIEKIRNFGLIPVVYESCIQKHGYLAGEDKLRAGDINAAFADLSINGILCVRGGYGMNRILPYLNYEIITKNPKIFCGYSDITALHIVLNQICGLETYHGPMPASDFSKDVDDYTMYYYKKLLFHKVPGFLFNDPNKDIYSLVNGICEGRLTGGNLSLVVASLGTPYEIDTKDKILFLEEIDEEVYRIDRMLVQLKNAGKLSECRGIILGQWTNCECKDASKSLDLMQVFHELIVPEHKPCIYNVSCGHTLPTLTLPLGARVRLNAYTKEIEVLE